MSRGRFYVPWLLFLGVVLLLPAVVTHSYNRLILVGAGIYGLIAIGLALLMGYAGQISLGQGAFYAVGSYSAAILATRGPLWWPGLGDHWVWLGIPVGVFLSVLIALVVGFPALRLRSHYLAMATLGIGVIVHQIASATDWLTNGERGIGGIPRLSILGYTVESELEHYYLVWGTIAAAMLLSLHLIHSRVGRALRSVHGDELAARSLGVNTSWYKVQVFMVSAAFASVAGSFHSYHESFIGPSTFEVHLSIILVVMVVVGGMSNVWGAFSGAVFLFILEEVLRKSQEWMPLIYGIILLLIMMFIPQGLFVGIGQGMGRIVRLIRRTGEEAAG